MGGEPPKADGSASPPRVEHRTAEHPRASVARWAAGTPGLVLATLGLVVVVLVLLDWRHAVGSGRELDLSVAGTQDAARSVVSSLSPTLENGVRHVLRLNLVLIVAYLAAVGLGLWWGRDAVKADAAKAAVAWVIAAVVAGAVLDVGKVIAVYAMLAGRFGPWPLLSASAAWTRWFLVFPAAAFALYAAFMRANRAAQGLARRSRRTPRGPGLLPQAIQADRPEPLPTSERKQHPEWLPKHNGNRIGIACSGGGIRSAAYNLGALQALHQRGVFQRASYLSAVSGGAYIAAAHAIVRKDSDPKAALDKTFEFAPGSPEERYLRGHTMYLADSTMGRIRFAVRVLMGAAWNFAFVYLVLLAISRPLAWFLTYQRVHPELVERTVSIPAYLWVVVSWPAALGILVGWIAILRRFEKESSYHGTIHAAVALMLLSAAMFVVIIALPWLVVYVPRAATAFLRWLPRVHVQQDETRNYLWLLQVLGATAVAGTVTRLMRSNVPRIALLATAIIVPFTFVVTLILLVGDAAALGPRGQMTIARTTVGPQWAWWLGISLVLVVFYGLSDETTWSMHPFYKRRLASAYALRRTSPTTVQAIDYGDLRPMSAYADPGNGEPWPELVLCAAANISDVGATPTGRRAVSFTFTATEVGGPEVGWIDTTEMEDRLGPRRKEDITIEAAVAISGAALSPAMGKMTRPGVAALIALMNARLGVWLPNPRWLLAMDPAEVEKNRWVQRPRAQYLMKEMLGRHRQDDLFVYVTDGGHWENLGLVELLRRGCTEIYCFDAAGDDIRSFFTLGEAVALARTELGVRIDIDPEDLEPFPSMIDGDVREHRSKNDHVVAFFRYPNGVMGRLLYCKAAVTESAPWDVKAYAEKNPRFPAHGTIDQLYSDQRFEAYRALGWHTADAAVAATGWHATHPPVAIVATRERPLTGVL